MTKFMLKFIGASVLVLWWIISGFLKKMLNALRLMARLKKIFLDGKGNSKGGKS